ncbi:MAG TPA: translation elongation factor Ts [Gemmataceae bacterium]|nr:translation elongation factor Ts [Gemmataceae bacterium]
MEISANDVKTLRDRTGVQMMKCKAALQEANGDMEKAIELIRKQNKDASVKLGSRETAEGRIATYIDPVAKVGAIVEVRCESAPVAKTDLFVKLAEDLARQVALKNPATPEELLAQPFVDKTSQTVSDRMSEVVGLVRENMKVARMKRLTGLLGHYIHHDGSVGVLVQVHGDKADDQLLRDISMHITAKNPTAALREHLPEDRIAKEKEIALAQMETDPKTKGKPAAILDKIIEGKLKTWFAENVLVEQPFVKDDSKTVGELLKSAGLTMVNFVRYRVGEVS